MEIMSAFKKTDDDWWSSYEIKEGFENDDNMLVEVALYSKADCSGLIYEWKIVVEGVNEYGLKKGFWNKNDALDMFIEIISLEKVNQNWLHDNGFTSGY